MPLFVATMFAAALPVVRLRAPTATQLAAIAAQLPDRPHGVVRLQCQIPANFRLVDRCAVVTPAETLNDAGFVTRLTIPPTAGSIEDVAIRLSEGALVDGEAAPMQRMVVVDRTVDFGSVPMTPPSDQPPLTLRTVSITPGPNFAQAQEFYPATALWQSAEASITATCRIQPDQQLICFKARVKNLTFQRPSPKRTEDAFVQATFTILSGTTVAAPTKDGTPTAGRDIELSFGWKLPGGR